MATPDERAVILAEGQCSHRGERCQWRTVAIFRVAQGRIAECWVIPHDQALFDRIWTRQRT